MFFAARALLLSGLLLAARPNSPPTPPPNGASALYKQAREKMHPALVAYGQALRESLESSNPYERHLALVRLAANAEILDDSWVPALVRRLVESAPLYDEGCANMIERLDKSYGGQGEEIEYARCHMKGGTSNGSLAAGLLARFQWPPGVVAFVMRGPQTVEAVLSSLGPGASAPGMEAALALAKLPSKSSDPAVETALMRMALVGRCTNQSPEALAAIALRFDSGAPAVREMAPLAYLRLTDCAANDKRYTESRARAVAAIEARLANDKDLEILDRLFLIGGAAHPLVPALLARTKATPKQLRKILEVLGVIGPAAHPAAPALVEILRDKDKTAWRGPALETLASIGAPAKGFKQAALDALVADGYLLEEVARALSAGSVRLSAKEFDLLVRPYREHCARAGSIFMFNLDRDEECVKIASSLGRLAELAKLSFRASNWRSVQEVDE